MNYDRLIGYNYNNDNFIPNEGIINNIFNTIFLVESDKYNHINKELLYNVVYRVGQIISNNKGLLIIPTDKLNISYFDLLTFLSYFYANITDKIYYKILHTRKEHLITNWSNPINPMVSKKKINGSFYNWQEENNKYFNFQTSSCNITICITKDGLKYWYHDTDGFDYKQS